MWLLDPNHLPVALQAELNSSRIGAPPSPTDAPAPRSNSNPHPIGQLVERVTSMGVAVDGVQVRAGMGLFPGSCMGLLF